MALTSVDPVRKPSSGQRGGSHMMLRRRDRGLSNGVESQNVEFKSNYRDEYLKAICAFAYAEEGLIDG